MDYPFGDTEESLSVSLDHLTPGLPLKRDVIREGVQDLLPDVVEQVSDVQTALD